jgi:Cu2+-exporting ATPase
MSTSTPSLSPTLDGHTVSRKGRLICEHCGTGFMGSERETRFCCSGCRFVFHLLHKRGLEDFYRYGQTRAPVGQAVFHERAWAWLAESQREVEARAADSVDVVELILQVQGISCAGCVWLLEAVFEEQAGAVSARVDSSSGTIHLRWQREQCDLVAYATDVQRFGYLLGPLGQERQASALRPLVRKMGLCAALALNAMLFALPRYLGIDPGDQLTALFDVVGFFLATASIVIGGPVFFQRAWAALRHKDLHIDFPISLGLIFAYSGSVLAWRAGDHSFAYFDFVSIFTFLMLVGRWLQERAVENNRRRLLDLRLTPGRVRVLENGLPKEIPAEALESGVRFAVERNALVPVRSRLLGSSGQFALNWINGEPAPREFPAGAPVPSGARNLGPDALEFLAMESWSDSQLARLLAFDHTQPWRNLAWQRIIRIYLSCVLVVGTAGFFFWGWGGGDWIAAWQVLISVLVVSCPCAIGVALPLLDDVVAARLQTFGVYVREHTLWHRLRRVKNVLFDKTGTLTLEHLALSNREELEVLGSNEKQRLLELVETSLHPVAACLRENLLAAGVELPPEAIPSPPPVETIGQGLAITRADGTWRIGRTAFARPQIGEALPGTVFSKNGNPVAVFHFREELRPGAAEQIQRLASAGYGLWLLSGDAPAKVRTMASNLGLPPEVGLGGLTPEQKAELVRERWMDNALLLGDGANDSLAFDAALCRGTPAVDTGLLEQKADFYLLGRSLTGLGELFAAGHRHRRATRTVFTFAISYNACAIGASLLGFMNPLVAAIIMPLSSLVSIALVFLTLKNWSMISGPSTATK